MLGIGWESSEDVFRDTSTKVASGNEVTVDEFDRIEALLAEAETQKATGRGPTVEVPDDIVMNIERPSFDFGAFDQLDARHSDSLATATDQTANSENQSADPPSRDIFDDRSSKQELQIPEALALGQGVRVAEGSEVKSQVQNSLEPTKDNSDDATESESLVIGPPTIMTETAGETTSTPVRIIASDVTTSAVTQFKNTDKDQSTEEVGRIRFTGTIFPVSRLKESD